MQSKFIVLAIIVIVTSCNYRNKKNCILTTTANRYNGDIGCPVNLYREYYHAFSSYMASDLNALYLTDSTSFRMNLGLYDTECGSIGTICHGDTLKVEKITKNEGYEMNEDGGQTDSAALRRLRPKIKVETKIYSLKKLKEDGDFDR